MVAAVASSEETLELEVNPENLGTAKAAKTPIITMIKISSINVKADFFKRKPLCICITRKEVF